MRSPHRHLRVELPVRARAPGTASSIPAAGTPQPRRRRRFDELRFYAEHFDTVEINSSFYGVPTASAATGWVERTPPGFEFSLKLFQKFTHPEMFQAATGEDPCEPDGAEDVDEFRAGIDPLAAAGKLGALLAQFPASFKNDPESRAYLEWLLEALPGLSARSSSCGIAAGATTRTDTLALLDAFGAAWAQIDEPKFRFSIRQDLLPNVQDVLLPAPARPQRRAVVEPPDLGGSLQLPLLGRRAAAIRRRGAARRAR